jgi:hypothetical protein
MSHIDVAHVTGMAPLGSPEVYNINADHTLVVDTIPHNSSFLTLDRGIHHAILV